MPLLTKPPQCLSSIPLCKGKQLAIFGALLLSAFQLQESIFESLLFNCQTKRKIEQGSTNSFLNSGYFAKTSSIYPVPGRCTNLALPSSVYHKPVPWDITHQSLPSPSFPYLPYFPRILSSFAAARDKAMGWSSHSWSDLNWSCPTLIASATSAWVIWEVTRTAVTCVSHCFCHIRVTASLPITLWLASIRHSTSNVRASRQWADER